jgi:prepilin-type N-terminal cleavage/methylation domain-containing protein
MVDRVNAYVMRGRTSRGITLLELMIVLAIVGVGMLLARTAFRKLSKADLVEDATELAAVLRRTSELAVEHGELHRVLLDLDKHAYVVEICQGATAIQRNEQVTGNEEDKKRTIERGKARLETLPTDAFAAGDPDEATKRATALAGHHVADRACVPATDTVTGDAEGKGWARKLANHSDVKFREVWVQHLDGAAAKGQVAIYFFSMGSSEKSVIELTDGSDVFSVLVYGLSGRVELRDGELNDVNEHMLKDVMGDREAKREDQR